MVFLSAPAFQFSSILVSLSLLALMVLMRPGLPSDLGALSWWAAGDLALIGQRLPPLLQPAILWPGYHGQGGLQVADIPTVTSLLLILGLACRAKALSLLCLRRLNGAATTALLVVPPVGVAVIVDMLPFGDRSMPIFVAAGALNLAQMWIIRRERAGSRALRTMNVMIALAVVAAVVFVAGTVAGAIPPEPLPQPGAPPYMPPLLAMVADFMNSIVMTFSMCMALQEHQQTFIVRLSTTDQLTGAVNRRGMLPLLEQALRRGARANEPVSIAVLDIDHFKLVNDHYGHEAGDAVLVGFADAVTALCRAGDVLGRWGGEEFLLLMPNTGATSALTAVQRIQAMLSDHLAGRVPRVVTFSAGIATVREHATAGGIDTLIARADKRLYAAKVSRNCVVSDGQEPAEATAARLAAAH